MDPTAHITLVSASKLIKAVTNFQKVYDTWSRLLIIMCLCVLGLICLAVSCSRKKKVGTIVVHVHISSS